ncbi:MAG TPA: ATP-binding protein, partial [Polyangia bacterium]
HAWAASRTAWPAGDGAGDERFSLAGVLADAVADVRQLAAERGVPVLVDLATPIEVSGARDLLRRALARVLRSAVAATRAGGSVVARAQILSGGRARIDIRDECGGGGVIPAGHCARPSTALAAPRAASADWAIVRGAVAANHGTVHARTLPGVGCLVTIDVPGRGDEAPCCEAEAATGT